MGFKDLTLPVALRYAWILGNTNRVLFRVQ